MSGVSSFNAGTVLMTVADVSTMIIKAGINEVDIGKIRLDQPVKVSFQPLYWLRTVMDKPLLCRAPSLFRPVNPNLTPIIRKGPKTPVEIRCLFNDFLWYGC
jgi:hypothetical protein